MQQSHELRHFRLFDLRQQPRDQAVISHALGLRLADYVVTAYGQNPINGFWFGGSIGFAAKPNPSRRSLELLPEIVVLWSPVPFNGESEKDRPLGVTSAQLGFNVSYDP